MSWTLLLGIVCVLGFSLFAAVSRRNELARMRRAVLDRELAVRQGSAQAQLRHPVVDLSRCLGCATCVAACPEDGVLDLVHGQAVVVNGARCQGISACERECPVGAIKVTIANLETRRDVPALDEQLEAIGSPGLFLAGEVTAHALIRTAVDQGTAVAAEVARRVHAAPGVAEEAYAQGVLDLCIVGAGPGGLACSLEAKRHGLEFVTLEQETSVGGTVAKYPRRKLVLTQPIDLPLYGRLGARSYSKEELMEIWTAIATEQELPIRGGEVFQGLQRDEHGTFLVHTQSGIWAARHVCIAIGRRGTPRKLGVPGEDLSKVAYSLLDAHSYQGRRTLVVGGGDSAVETALALAEQPGNQVTLSYRKESFFRVKRANEERIAEASRSGRLQVVLQSEVVGIAPDAVELTLAEPSGARRVAVPNDEVFVMAGGVAPFELLERSGVSFDPSLRPAEAPIEERGTGFVQAVALGFTVSLLALLWALWHGDYYLLPSVQRPAHLKHDLLRPSDGIGLWLGVASVALIGLNLAYLVRRSPRFRFAAGSLQLWMTSHVATGVLALLCAMLHGAMSPRDTVGGHAFWSLAVLLLTGAIGRYFYAWVPRAANGRELELEEVKSRLGLMSEEWDQGQHRFRERVRLEVGALVERYQWRASFLGRVAGLVAGQRRLGRALARLARAGRRDGVPEGFLHDTLRLARRAHRSALMAAHYEDLRGVLSSWRYLHRWFAALMVLLVLVHVVYALVYGESSFTGVGR